MLPLDFMSKLGDAGRAALLGLGKHTQCGRHQIIFRAGEDDPHVYVVIDGRVKVYQVLKGRESILWFCGKGEVFGLAEAIHGRSRDVCARAAVDSEIVAIEATRFVSFVLEHKDVGRRVLETLAERVRTLRRALVDATSSDVASRVINVLCHTGRQHGVDEGEVIRITIPLTHREIAQMIGASRQTVTAILGDLRRRNLIRIEGRRLYLLDPDALEALSLGTEPARPPSLPHPGARTP